MTDKLLFFTPVFKEKIWGGNKLKEVFGFNTESDKTGECWAISAQPGSESICTTEGFEGKTFQPSGTRTASFSVSTTVTVSPSSLSS